MKINVKQNVSKNGKTYNNLYLDDIRVNLAFPNQVADLLMYAKDDFTLEHSVVESNGATYHNFDMVSLHCKIRLRANSANDMINLVNKAVNNG